MPEESQSLDPMCSVYVPVPEEEIGEDTEDEEDEEDEDEYTDEEVDPDVMPLSTNPEIVVEEEWQGLTLDERFSQRK
jgi:hypothetical protein